MSFTYLMMAVVVALLFTMIIIRQLAISFVAIKEGTFFPALQQTQPLRECDVVHHSALHRCDFHQGHVCINGESGRVCTVYTVCWHCTLWRQWSGFLREALKGNPEF